jgi:hypothetical protein
MFGVLFAAFFMQMFTAVTFMMCNSSYYVFIGKMLGVISIFVLLFLFLYAYSNVNQGRKMHLNDDDYYLRQVDENLYYHPMDKRASS